MKTAVIWDSELVFHQAHDFYETVLSDMATAASSIDLEVYIFRDDTLGNRFSAALKTAAERNVRLRVIVDGFGSAEWIAHSVPELLKAGVDVRVFRPMPWLFLTMTACRVPSLKRMLHLFAAINRRNHRKSWVVDKRIAYVGSLNICKDHLKMAEGGSNWRDTGLRVEGSAVAELISGFDKTWAQSWRFGERRRHFHPLFSSFKPFLQSGLVRLNDDARSRRWLFRDLLKRISAARRSIWITNPYFIPLPRLVLRLCTAAQSGIDVRILVPHRPDVWIIRWVTATFYAQLLRSRVRIFEYLPAVVHAKIVQIDDWAAVGSSNLNHRSFVQDLEVDLAVSHEDTRQSLSRQFLLDLTKAEEISVQSFSKRPLLGSLAGQIFLLFRHWM